MGKTFSPCLVLFFYACYAGVSYLLWETPAPGVAVAPATFPGRTESPAPGS